MGRTSFKTQLQNVVDEVECGKECKSFLWLCQAVVNSEWNENHSYKPMDVANLLYEQDINTHTDKPDPDELEQAMQEPKRGRGRPKKVVEPLGDCTAVSRIERIELQNGHEADVVITSAEAPRKRGRPRKEVPVEIASKDVVEVVAEMRDLWKPPVTPIVKEEKEDEPIIVKYPTESCLTPRQSAPVEKLEPIESCDSRLRKVSTPAGDCPCKLKGTSFEEIVSWAQNVIQKGHETGVHYQNQALRYFVRHFYELGTPEHKEVCNVLKEQRLGLAASQRVA